MSTPIKNLVIPASGTQEVKSGATLTIDAGATIINNGTATGFTSGGALWGDITGTLSDQTDLQAELDAKLSIDSNAYVTAFNSRTGNVALATADVNAVGPLTLNVTGNVTGNVSGSAGSVAVGNITGAGTGVLTALANATNGASGPVVLNGSTQLPAVSGTNLTAVPSNTALYPTLNQNTSGTASNVSGTPALPNGTTATTQTAGDSTTKLATTAFVGAAATVLTGSNSLPFLLGPKTHNYINAGDSLTQGPSGLASLAPFAFSADQQGMGLGQASADLFYNMGFSGDKTSQISTRYANSGVTTNLTTTSGSATATVASASGISNGMCIGSANTSPNTTLTISGTTVTLSRVATATGTVTCSVASAPVGNFSELYAGGLANGWQNFSGTPHQLSFAVSGIASTYMLWAGANDYVENVASAVTVTATTTSGSPNVTVTAGTFSGIVNGCVITSSNLPSAVPLYVISGAGTANLVLSGNATGSGSASTVAHFPTTAFVTWQSTYSSLVTTAKADSNTVYAVTLPPAGTSGAGSQGDPVSNSFRLQWNTWIVANSAAANYVIDVTTVLPAYGSVAGSAYYTADNLHFSNQGHALLARFFTQQIFSQQLTTALAWNPFAVNALPDAWLSTNIPLKNAQNVFNPASSATAVTAAITATSTAGTLAASQPAIFTGMYVSGWANGVNYFAPNTTVTVSGTSLTFSSASNVTAGAATLYFSYSPFPAETVFKQNVRFGPNGDVNAGSLANAEFTSQADGFSPGALWLDVNGKVQWLATAPTSGTGSFFIGNAASTAVISMASTGTITITGNLTNAGTNTWSGANTFSNTTAFTGGNNSVYVQNSSASGFSLLSAKNNSGTFTTQIGHANASAGTFYGTGTPGNDLIAYAGTLYGTSPAGATTPFWSLDQSGNFTLLGNTTFSTAGKGIVGGTTATLPSAGNVGNVQTNLVASGSPVSITTATPTNIVSKAVSAGHYLVTFQPNFTATAATILPSNPLIAGISTTSATLPTDGSEGYSSISLTIASASDSVPVASKVVTLTGSGTIYGVMSGTFSAGTLGGFGSLTVIQLP